jgi:hypothetical protein
MTLLGYVYFGGSTGRIPRPEADNPTSVALLMPHVLMLWFGRLTGRPINRVENPRMGSKLESRNLTSRGCFVIFGEFHALLCFCCRTESSVLYEL